MDAETAVRDQAEPGGTQRSGVASVNGESSQVLVEVLRELREERAEERRARRSERRSKMFFQVLFFGTPVIVGVLYFLYFMNFTGFRWGPWSDVVGVVRIDGEISAQALTAAKKVIPALEKAFANPGVKAVVLSIDSPGGAPSEAEQIYTALGALKRKHPKPVVAVINNLGASAAYLIAMHADKVYAGKYSLVGSIGAIMAPWDLHRAIDKVGVSQRVYASGKLKAFLNPFKPVTREVDAKAQQMVNQMAQVFLTELRATRGKALVEGVDYGTGEIWGGFEAKELGLVDAIGTLDEVVSTMWGLKTYDFGPVPEGMGVLSSSVSGSALSILEGWLLHQSFEVR